MLLQSRLLLCWHGFCDLSVTLCNISITLSKYILDVHPRSDATELAEAVLIALMTINASVYVFHIKKEFKKLHHNKNSRAGYEGLTSLKLKQYKQF